jgi:hypothetical protein
MNETQAYEKLQNWLLTAQMLISVHYSAEDLVEELAERLDVDLNQRWG